MDLNTEIEEIVKDGLSKLEILVSSIVYTSVFPTPLLSITLYTSYDFDALLELVDYKYKCDRSGFILLKDTNTIIFTKETVSLLMNKL